MTLLSTTEFICKVCGKPIEFDITKEKTYISKTEHEDFFGMKLTTYRVSHDDENERHYNSVVVDHMGLFRGHRDAYSEPIHALDPSTERRYWVYHEDEKTGDPTNGIGLALLISRNQRWVVDIVCPTRMNASEIATLVLDRVEEAWRIYNDIPQPMETHFADLDFHVWTSDERVLCVSFNNPKLLKPMESIARQIVTENDESIIPRRRLLNLVFQILEKDPNLSPQMLSKIMNEDMLFTTFHTPYEDRIPSIVERTTERLPIAKDILGPLLRGYLTLIDMLEGEYCSRYKEIFELVDFINRRRVLG
ncbi:MAG: hypothetical protein ACFFED_15270 [Candidatus Thorarchaeota archaeon]